MFRKVALMADLNPRACCSQTFANEYRQGTLFTLYIITYQFTTQRAITTSCCNHYFLESNTNDQMASCLILLHHVYLMLQNYI